MNPTIPANLQLVPTGDLCRLLQQLDHGPRCHNPNWNIVQDELDRRLQVVMLRMERVSANGTKSISFVEDIPHLKTIF